MYVRICLPCWSNAETDLIGHDHWLTTPPVAIMLVPCVLQSLTTCVCASIVLHARRILGDPSRHSHHHHHHHHHLNVGTLVHDAFACCRVNACIPLMFHVFNALAGSRLRLSRTRIRLSWQCQASFKLRMHHRQDDHQPT